MRLGVNIDHVATLRQARRGIFPDPVAAALLAQEAGCDGIVCHLREDRRHIQDRDLPALKKRLKIPLNLEMGAHPDILEVACRVRPHQATLVPERRQELTTEGGLDLRKGARRLTDAIAQLQAARIQVSLFIDPDPVQIRLAAQWGVEQVELHTGRYAQLREPLSRRNALADLRKSATLASELGLVVAAGHGLDERNVVPVARIPQVEELNIGFSIIGRAIEIGLAQAVVRMKRAIRRAVRS
jgi:pyridoxine 5-phosphate synthase